MDRGPKFCKTPPWIMRIDLTPSESRVLHWLGLHQHDYAVEAQWCGDLRIAFDTDQRADVVRRALAGLLQKGVIAHHIKRIGRQVGWVILDHHDIVADLPQHCGKGSADDPQRCGRIATTDVAELPRPSLYTDPVQTQGEEEISDQVVTDQIGGVTPAPAAAVTWSRIVALAGDLGMDLSYHAAEWQRDPACRYMLEKVGVWNEQDWTDHVKVAIQCENWKRTGKRWKSPSVLRMIIDSVCQIPVGSEDTQWGEAWV